MEGKQLRVYRTREGKSVTVGGPVPFAAFEAGISDEVKPQLVGIAAELAGKPNKIEIRAHCSPVELPSGSSFGDKFVLTYERARNVLRFLERHKIDYKHMRISAVADSEPLSRRSDRQSLQLDRVEVVILDAFADEFFGPREMPK